MCPVKLLGTSSSIAIKSPKVTAQYHSIYILSFAHGAIARHTSRPDQIDLILRVSGPHVPRIKTENEVATLSWISQNTSIPVPAVVHYDSSTNNPIAHEYIILVKEPGQSLSDVCKSLDQRQLSDIIDQLIDVLLQLHAKQWHQIGGLQFSESGQIVVGPVLEETFWQVPDIERYWGPDESIETLNIRGPFNSYVEYITAHIRKYIYAITVHDSLAFMRDVVPRLDAFLDILSKDSAELNNVKLRLAHKDLHFANILYDVDSGKITCILDWEFSGVVPFTRWNPTKAFLWNGHERQKDLEETAILFQLFVDRCAERSITIPKDAEFASFKQENMQKAANLLRAIVEVSPRGQKQDLVGKWKEAILGHISTFGV